MKPVTDRLTEVYDMIELKEDLAKDLIDKAINKASLVQEDQLVSITKKVRQANPIQVFEQAKILKKDRVFWSNQMENYCMVGIGKTVEIIADESRYKTTKKEWKKHLKDAFIHNPYQAPGTGLVALGGLSFDPKKNTTKLWEHYHASQFTIPEYLLTQIKEESYLTITLKVNEEDDLEEVVHRVNQVEELLLNQTTTLPHPATILSQYEVEPEQWLNIVQKAIDTLNTTQADKIVLARELNLKLNKNAELATILDRLLKTQTNSYVFAFEKGEDCFIGATPERLIKLTGNCLLSTCLAGTAPRGKTEQADEEIKHNLFHDEKNREEHDEVVQFIHQNINKYCTDIDIPHEPIIYPLKNLHHLYTPVTARLKEGIHVFDIIEHLHPTPALGGSPQENSLQFIRENELLDRGWYGAPIGWLDSNENAEFAVAIRSGLIRGNDVSLFAGCGVMKDSDPQSEYEETNIKFLPMLSVLEDQHESY